MFYRCFLTTKIRPKDLKEQKGIIVIEPEYYTKAEVKAIRKKGYKVLAYLSAGSIEKERPWYGEYKKYSLRQLPDWPKEYYMDLRKTAWRKFLKHRAIVLKDLGYDGWWVDNLDVYSEYKSPAMFTAAASILKDLKKAKGYIMINGGSEWLDDAMDKGLKLKDYLSGYTQEEVFSRILDYSGKGKFGRQKASDSKYYQKILKRVRGANIDGFLLEYTRDDKVKLQIKDFYKSAKLTGYHIAKDVNL